MTAIVGAETRAGSGTVAAFTDSCEVRRTRRGGNRVGTTLAVMAVRIRDTLQREVVELTTREPGKLSMYVCGPTVYDAPHIGNARTAVVFDTIRRYLEWTGLDVTYITNVTDVDDKIIARAAEQGRTEPDLAAENEAVYFEQMAQLGVRESDRRPHATEYIDHMIDLVQELVDRGHAYAVEDQGVYFAVETFPGYGALPNRTIDDLRDSAGARVEVDEAKRAPMDFALWKAAKPGEPAWDSPWGKGRPGWHIECSAMSLDLLGEGFDVHGGGTDLLFPHHENERAQANAAGHEFARHWVHSGMVTISGEKMAKSAGNFLTLADALATHDPRAVRLSMLQTNYGRAVDLGPQELDAAEGRDGPARRARPPRGAGRCHERRCRGRRHRRRAVPGGDGRRLQHAAGAGGRLRGEHAGEPGNRPR